jgi:hypothetical protein
MAFIADLKLSMPQTVSLAGVGAGRDGDEGSEGQSNNTNLGIVVDIVLTLLEYQQQRWNQSPSPSTQASRTTALPDDGEVVLSLAPLQPVFHALIGLLRRSLEAEQQGLSAGGASADSSVDAAGEGADGARSKRNEWRRRRRRREKIRTMPRSRGWCNGDGVEGEDADDEDDEDDEERMWWTGKEAKFNSEDGKWGDVHDEADRSACDGAGSNSCTRDESISATFRRDLQLPLLPRLLSIAARLAHLPRALFAPLLLSSTSHRGSQRHNASSASGSDGGSGQWDPLQCFALVLGLALVPTTSRAHTKRLLQLVLVALQHLPAVVAGMSQAHDRQEEQQQCSQLEQAQSRGKRRVRSRSASPQQAEEASAAQKLKLFKRMVPVLRNVLKAYEAKDTVLEAAVIRTVVQQMNQHRDGGDEAEQGALAGLAEAKVRWIVRRWHRKLGNSISTKPGMIKGLCEQVGRGGRAGGDDDGVGGCGGAVDDGRVATLANSSTRVHTEIARLMGRIAVQVGAADGSAVRLLMPTMAPMWRLLQMPFALPTRLVMVHSAIQVLRRAHSADTVTSSSRVTNMVNVYMSLLDHEPHAVRDAVAMSTPIFFESDQSKMSRATSSSITTSSSIDNSSTTSSSTTSSSTTSSSAKGSNRCRLLDLYFQHEPEEYGTEEQTAEVQARARARKRATLEKSAKRRKRSLNRKHGAGSGVGSVGVDGAMDEADEDDTHEDTHDDEDGDEDGDEYGGEATELDEDVRLDEDMEDATQETTAEGQDRRLEQQRSYRQRSFAALLVEHTGTILELMHEASEEQRAKVPSHLTALGSLGTVHCSPTPAQVVSVLLQLVAVWLKNTYESDCAVAQVARVCASHLHILHPTANAATAAAATAAGTAAATVAPLGPDVVRFFDASPAEFYPQLLELLLDVEEDVDEDEVHWPQYIH